MICYSIFFLLPTNPMPKKRPKLTNKALICLSTLYPMNAGTCEASDLSLQESHPLLQVPDDSISLLDDSPGVLQLQSQTNKYKRNSVRCSGRDATDVSNRSRCSITYSWQASSASPHISARLHCLESIMLCVSASSKSNILTNGFLCVFVCAPEREME